MGSRSPAWTIILRLYQWRWRILGVLLTLPAILILGSGYGRSDGSWAIALLVTYGVVGLVAVMAYLNIPSLTGGIPPPPYG